MRRLLLTTGFVAIATWLAWAQTRTGPVLFEGARLVTGEPRAPLDDSAFLVDAGRITAVGARGTVKAPPGATVIDLRGKTVMPALVDAHSHLGYTDVRTGPDNRCQLHASNLLDHLRRYAYLRHRRDGEPGPRSRRAALRAAGDAHPRRGALPHRRTRHRDAECRAECGVLEGCGVRRHDRGRGQAAVRELAAKKLDLVNIWVETGTRRSHRFHRRCIGRSSRRHTRAAFASSRTCITWPMRKAASRRHRRLRARHP